MMKVLKSSCFHEVGYIICFLLLVREKHFLVFICNASSKAIEHSLGYEGHGGSLVDSSTFVQRVVGSNPALAATK